MSFQAPPPPTIPATPSINDDATKGINVGMTVVDTTVNPPVVYVCTSNTPGAAKWSAVGVTVQVSGLPLGAVTTLNFQSAVVAVSNGVATVAPSGGWRSYAAFSAMQGQTFFPLVGVSVAPQSHQVFANGMLLRLGAQYDYTIDGAGVTLSAPLALDAGQPLIVYY
jgi:hypothetical protein